MPPANVPEAPLDGATKVTTRPDSGLFAASRTPALSAMGYAVFAGALCGDPPSVTSAPGMLVSLRTMVMLDANALPITRSGLPLP